MCDATQKFLDHLEEHYVQAPVSAGDRVLHNLTKPHVIQCLQKYDPHLRKSFLRASKGDFRTAAMSNFSIVIVASITSSFNFHAEHPNSSSALLGHSWTAAVSTSVRLTLRDNQAFLKSAGLILPPQNNSQAVQFGNEDASLLFRASHHASTSVSANQKALDAPDLGYCEFLEFLCRLSLAPNFKVLGDTTDDMRMQKLCNVSSRFYFHCAFVPAPTSAVMVPPLTHDFLIRLSSRGLMTKPRAQTIPRPAAGRPPRTAL